MVGKITAFLRGTQRIQPAFGFCPRMKRINANEITQIEKEIALKLVRRNFVGSSCYSRGFAIFAGLFCFRVQAVPEPEYSAP